MKQCITCGTLLRDEDNVCSSCKQQTTLVDVGFKKKKNEKINDLIKNIKDLYNKSNKE